MQGITPDRWQQIKQLFHSALEQPEPERAEHVRRAAGGDPVLLEQVQALLSSHAEASGLLEQPALEMLEREGSEYQPGAHIGPYRLCEEIGHGGMGTVYLATRDDDEFQQRVAIKVVSRGMDTDMVLRRFRNERQILAGLDHLNIARLFDGGTTADGRPFFVMEHIEGAPIDEYCDQQKLSVSQRLELFRTVCAAVHHAHQRLIVHRDLKPDNILITAEGIPKLLDFGIAKILNPEASDADPTLTALRPMTPGYASPEQVRGEVITTASDVYSLGVLLYELLTGQKPYHLHTRHPEEVAKAICEQEPERPSTAVTRMADSADRGAAVREGTVKKLRRRLAGDLDNIVLTAMRKDPARRYPSAAQLSEDLRRHLAGMPVLAQKDTWRYRTAKFLQRNRVAVAVAAVLLLAILGGVVGTAWQARVASQERARAERRFNDVRRLANSLIFELHDAIAVLPGSTPAREMLSARALEYLDSLSREGGQDVELRREVAAAYDRLGDVLGRWNTPNLGKADQARGCYQKALAIREALLQEAPEYGPVRADLAGNYSRLAGMAWARGEFAESEQSYNNAAQLYDGLEAQGLLDTSGRISLAITLGELGRTQTTQGRAEEGLNTCRKAVALLEQLSHAEPSNQEALEALSVSYYRVTEILELANMPEALRWNQKVIAVREQLVTLNPLNQERRRLLAGGYFENALIRMKLGENRAALADAEKALAILQRLAASDPQNVQYQIDLSGVQNEVGMLLVRTGRAQEALRTLHRALRSLQALYATDSNNVILRFRVANAQEGLGAAHMALASRLNLTREAQLEHWNVARNFLSKSLLTYREFRDKGITTGDDEKTDEVAALLTQCDASIAKTQSDHRKPD